MEVDIQSDLILVDEKTSNAHELQDEYLQELKQVRQNLLNILDHVAELQE